MFCFSFINRGAEFMLCMQMCICTTQVKDKLMPIHCEEFRTMFYYTAVLLASKLQWCRGAFQPDRMHSFLMQRFFSLVDDYTILHKNRIPYCSAAVKCLQFSSVGTSPQGIYVTLGKMAGSIKSGKNICSA